MDPLGLFAQCDHRDEERDMRRKYHPPRRALPLAATAPMIATLLVLTFRRGGQPRGRLPGQPEKRL
jgi:hypothetical protein